MSTEVTRVGVSEALALLEQDHRYLDVRTTLEFDQGHPQGAYNVPIKNRTDGQLTDNGRFLSVVQRHFPTDTPLVVGCRSGNRSMQAVRLLQQAGYRCLVDLRPGFGGVRDAFGRLTEDGWLSSKAPVSYEAEPGRDYAGLRGADDQG